MCCILFKLFFFYNTIVETASISNDFVSCASNLSFCKYSSLLPNVLLYVSHKMISIILYLGDCGLKRACGNIVL
jgi:hypothetical protein